MDGGIQRPLWKIENENHMKNVIGMTVDVVNKRLFFSDIQRGDIQYVYFNGTEFTVVVDCKYCEQNYVLYNNQMFRKWY